jgi:hypothetical protein
MILGNFFRTAHVLRIAEAVVKILGSPIAV